MRKLLHINLFILITTIFFLTSCVTHQKTKASDKIIKHSCNLLSKINDTVMIEGIYSKCMEYSSFKTIKKDPCQDDFNMQLNFDDPNLDQNAAKSIYNMNACNATRKMILRGILIKAKSSYGHLGTNNTEFIVVKIISLNKIKLNKTGHNFTLLQ